MLMDFSCNIKIIPSPAYGIGVNLRPKLLLPLWEKVPDRADEG